MIDKLKTPLMLRLIDGDGKSQAETILKTMEELYTSPELLNAENFLNLFIFDCICMSDSFTEINAKLAEGINKLQIAQQRLTLT